LKRSQPLTLPAWRPGPSLSPLAARGAWRTLLQPGDTEGRAKAVGAVERVAVFAMHRGVVRAGEQQPVAVMRLVFGPILERDLADLLVVRVVAHARRHQCEVLHQRAAVLVVFEIGLGPVDTGLAVERDHGLVEPTEDFLARQLRRACRRLWRVWLGVVDALL